MGSSGEQAELLCRVDFPLYAISVLSPRHVMVGGGGGAANTGVKNGLQVFEISCTGEQVVGESVTRHFTGEFSVYSMAVKPAGNNNEGGRVTVAAGHGQYCQLYSLSLDRERGGGEEAGDGLRHRGNGRASGAGVQEEAKLVYKVEPLKRVQTDFHPKEPHGKVIRISGNGKLLATGGDDGHLRVWSFPELAKVHDFSTHEKEIDDIDFSPDSSKLISVSKDKRAIVWDVRKGRKHAELGWEPPQGVKYMYKRCKFACVEGDQRKYKVYTISNPVSSSKSPAVIQRWNTQSFTVEQSVSSPGLAYSALAITDNGTFLGTGTMSEGLVDIYTAYNLVRVRRIRGAHSTFITGLEWLPTTEESAACRGLHEASIVSVSVDHQVCVHHVDSQTSVSSLSAMVLVILVLLGTFLLASYLGL